MLIFNDREFSIRQIIPILLMCLPVLMNMNTSFTIPKFLKNNDMTFTAKLKLNAWRAEPDSTVRAFSNCLWEWNRNNQLINCRQLVEEFSTSGYWGDHNLIRGIVNPTFVDDKGSEFWNKTNPNIHYSMWFERNSDRDGNEHAEIYLKIRFLLSTMTSSDIINHINYIKAESKRIDTQYNKSQKVLVSTNIKMKDDSDNSRSPNFMMYQFKTTSSFSNFFSEESDSVHKDVVSFMNNKSEYERIGRPWTYTILNEGPPGVGKTKLVKSVAALTSRTLIIINLNHFDSIVSLYEAFHSSILGGEEIPHNERLYYIPEVDTCIDNLKERKMAVPDLSDLLCLEKGKELGESGGGGGGSGGGSEKSGSLISAVAKADKPTLGQILNVLDGIPERHGHIIIIDTNMIDKLDKALTRPGRVDRIISWGKMTAVSMRRYLEHYYKDTMPEDVDLPDKVFSAAELQAKVYEFETLDAFIDRVC